MIKVFLAGTVQGADAKANADQTYRTELTELLHREFGDDVKVIDPTAWTASVFSRPEARERIAALSRWEPLEPLRPSQVGGVLDEACGHFWEQARRVAKCDVCVAYLPGDGMSMGTAMEMGLAHEAGVPVIAVTTNTTNLAILSASDVVVRDFAAVLREVADVHSRIGQTVRPSVESRDPVRKEGGANQ